MKKTVFILVAAMAVISLLIVAPASAGDKCCKGEQFVVIGEGSDAVKDCIMVCSAGGDEEDVVKVKVKKSKCGAYLGIYMEDLTKKLRKKYDYPEKRGVLITDIVEDSPAEEAGLDEDDIIYLFAGEKVDDAKSLASMVGNREPGEEVEIVFYRDGKKKEIKVELDEHPFQSYAFDWEEVGEHARDFGKFAGKLGKSIGYFVQSSLGLRGRLGLELTDLDEDLAGYFDVGEDEGVLVLKVIEDSPAEKVGIKAGDVIVAIQGEDVSDVDEVMDEISEIDVDEEDKVEIEVVRKGQRKTFKLDMEDFEGDHFYWTPKEHSYRIEVPEIEKIKVPELKVKEVELQKELKELKKKLKKMEERLEELEKD